MTDSSAKEISGMMAKNAVKMISKMLMGQLALRSLTSETWPLLPVTVVKDLRLPVKRWLTPRIRQPSRMETNAMM